MDDIGASIVVPVRWQESTIGLLVLGSRLSRSMYEPPDIDLLRSVAAHAAIAVKNAELRAEIIAEKEHTENVLAQMASGVVAIDAHGTQSGCSDYAELPHPFIYTEPVATAKVGQEYRCQLESLRSLGDYQCKQDPASKQKKYAYRFWDIDENTFKLVAGPPWLTIDAKTGMLSGTPGPGDVGMAKVKLEVANQFGGHTERVFEVTVAR